MIASSHGVASTDARATHRVPRLQHPGAAELQSGHKNLERIGIVVYGEQRESREVRQVVFERHVPPGENDHEARFTGVWTPIASTRRPGCRRHSVYSVMTPCVYRCDWMR
jgi:hypothetical protein